MSLFKRISEATLDYSHEPVPDDQTRPAWRLFGVWIVNIINLAFISIGLSLSQSVPPSVMVPGVLTGQAILALFVCLSANIGVQTRLPTAAVMPLAMGRYPAMIFMALVGLSVVGWFGFHLEIFIRTLQSLLAPEDPESVPGGVMTVLGGLIMLSSAIIGFKAIDWISQFGAPALVILMLWPLGLYYFEGGDFTAFALAEDKSSMGFGAVVSIFISGAAIMMIAAPDISRYTRSASGAVTATFSGLFFGASAIYALSVLLGYISSAGSVAELLAAFQLGLAGFLLVLIATWTTNDTNIYIGSLAFTSVFQKIRKWILALVLGLIGIAIALFGIVDRFVEWISLLGIVFPAGAAVFITDYYMNPEKYRDAHLKDKEPVRVSALIALLLGMGVSYATGDPETFGGGWFTLTTIPSMDGLLSAGVVYVALSYLKTVLRELPR